MMDSPDDGVEEVTERSHDIALRPDFEQAISGHAWRASPANR